MIRRPPRSTLSSSSAASDVYKRQIANKAHRRAPFPDAAHLLNRTNMAAAAETITSWPGYAPTELVDLPEVASHCGVARVVYKDESTRLGLGAFKALGGAYAVAALIKQKQADGIAAEAITVATATDGNHGRSVAWGAKQAGCGAKIYIHQHVSKSREDAMRVYGADVIRVDGNYEFSVARCKADSEANSWSMVSDTSWEGYTDVPRTIMAGYTLMGTEVVSQLGDDDLTHAFLPVGVGGLAAGIAAPLWAHMGEQLCNLISVESTMSCCFADSIRAGAPTLVDITDETLMAGLSCGEVSLLAWEILQPVVSHAMAISDDAVEPLMKWFHHRTPSIEAGECSTSGLAALLQAHQDPARWKDMGFDANSVVLLIGTEGATDPELYHRIVASTDQVDTMKNDLQAEATEEPSPDCIVWPTSG
eukprot:TRINITY_DN914_c0_g1_i5.p1 TRINITY_DN914_c0_g1~~TRINITY_DN914_c0_g1_i5.p1  ORF type:complete len:420 (-),score=73.42 TRINITY_DN914_c0_g1_i5:412-1671(-)